MTLTLPIKPQLAELVQPPTQAPDGHWILPKFLDDEGWAFEFKWDGHRLIVDRHAGGVRLFARSGRVVTTEYPEIATAAHALPVGTILDGEVVALVNGKSNLQALAGRAQQTIAWRQANVHYFAFDILQTPGGVLERLPYSRRRESLEATFAKIPAASPLEISRFVTDAGLMWDLVVQYELEGMIAKPLEAPYMQDARGPWRKIKLNQRDSFTVAGFTEGKGHRLNEFGALVLAEVDNTGNYRYAGKCGTGFDGTTMSQLFVQMMGMRNVLRQSIFNQPQEALARVASPGNEITWLMAGLVVEIEFAERSDDQILRFPSYKGVVNVPTIATIRAGAPLRPVRPAAPVLPPAPPRPTGVAVGVTAPSSGVLKPAVGMAFLAPGSSKERNVVVQGKPEGMYLACDCPAGKFVWKGGSFKPCKHMVWTLSHELAGNTIVDGIFQ